MATDIPESGFKGPKEFMAWLDSLPIENRVQISGVLAYRSSMRALPFVVHGITDASDVDYSTISALLSVFRANVTARIALKYKTEQTAEAARYAADNLGSEWSTNPAARSAIKSVASACIAAAYQNIDPMDEVSLSAYTDAAADAADAAAYSASASKDPGNSIAFEQTWNELSKDAQLIENGRAPLSLIELPLWSGARPEWWSDEWHGSRHKIQLLDDRWTGISDSETRQYWVDWYEARTQGRFPWDLSELAVDEFELRVALGDRRAGFWRRIPGKINAEIGSWLDLEIRKNVSSESGQEWDFFISYSSRDEKMAREVDEIVRSTGKSTFVQFRNFGPGTNLVREMQRGLANTGRVIALYSPDYEASDHCQAEWSAAYNSDPGSVEGKLLPFLLRPTELNMLARQIVYTDLVGLGPDARRQAILHALAYKPTQRSKADLKKVLADIQTPVPVQDTKMGKERVGLASNPDLDTPLSDDDLRELPGWLIDLASAILASLPGNTPPAFRAFLELYQKHLIERGPRPHTDRLRSFASPLRKEFEGVESSLWSPGLEDAIRDFLKKHELLITHYPLPEARERALSETQIDEAAATGSDLTEPIYTAAEALEDLSKFDMTTEEFDAFVANVLRAADEYARMPFTSADDARPQTEITPKRRYVLTTAGFFERTAAFIAASVTIAATPQGQAAILFLRKAVEKLLAFVI